MEKRIGSTEYRLGIYENWPINFHNITKKYYTDSLRMNLLLNQIFIALQKDLKILIPFSLISYYINNKVFNLNFSYFQIARINRFAQLNLKKIESDDEENLIFEGSDKVFDKKILPHLKLILKKKYKEEEKQNKIKLIAPKKYKTTKIKKKKKALKIKNILKLTYFILHKKWHELLLKEMFSILFTRLIIINTTNLDLIFVKKYGPTTHRLFFLIKDWYKRIGGNITGINKKLLYLHYSLSYKNFTPIILDKLKRDLETKPFSQKQTMNNFYNLLLAYAEIQRNIGGIRLCFKGTIGKHGRAKTMHFFTGRLYTFELSMPVEYSAINIDSVFGTIGLRWWLGYIEENYTKERLEAIGTLHA